MLNVTSKNEVRLETTKTWISFLFKECFSSPFCPRRNSFLQYFRHKPTFILEVRETSLYSKNEEKTKGNKVESSPSTPYMSWHYSVFWGETSKFLLKCNLEFFLQWWAKSEPIISLILLKWSSVNKTLDIFKKSYHYHLNSADPVISYYFCYMTCIWLRVDSNESFHHQIWLFFVTAHTDPMFGKILDTKLLLLKPSLMFSFWLNQKSVSKNSH